MANLTCMAKSYIVLKDDTDKQRLGEANKFSYKWYEVQSSYNIDLYVHKDRHMIDRTVIL